jgi:acyl-CoA thioesterase YciA
MEHVSSKLCLVKDVGVNGNLFGGNMMAWMDEIAAIYAMKITSENNLVTLRFGEILFKRPVKVNDIVDFYCEWDLRQGKTSIGFKIFALVDNEIVFNTDCTFVAVDGNGNKKDILWNVK